MPCFILFSEVICLLLHFLFSKYDNLSKENQNYAVFFELANFNVCDKGIFLATNFVDGNHLEIALFDKLYTIFLDKL